MNDIIRKGFIYRDINIISNTEVANAWKCTALCRKDENCHSYAFSPSLHKCQLHNLYDPVKILQKQDYIFCTQNKGN